MRDTRFVAAHRGGQLSKEQHHELMLWACACAEHLFILIDGEVEERLSYGLRVGRLWTEGRSTVGEARAASLALHAFARESTNPVISAVARAVGHAVATAHMADHALGPVYYGLKAVKAAGLCVQTEKDWQMAALPLEIEALVLSALESNKFKGIPK
jgi:hypothetical protein